MIRRVLRGFLSTVLMFVVSGGGGGLPVLDAALFHGFGPGPDYPGAHYEASSGCHTDRCSVRSLAYDLRFAPEAPEPALAVALPVSTDRALPVPPRPRAAAQLPTLSRAPPSIA